MLRVCPLEEGLLSVILYHLRQLLLFELEYLGYFRLNEDDHDRESSSV